MFFFCFFVLPRLVKRLCDHRISQVMCGNQHCIALSRGVKSPHSTPASQIHLDLHTVLNLEFLHVGVLFFFLSQYELWLAITKA